MSNDNNAETPNQRGSDRPGGNPSGGNPSGSNQAGRAGGNEAGGSRPPVPDLTSRHAADEAVRATRRFDLRRILGALFGVYGVIVTIVGIVNHDTDGIKTGGIQINLWAGIAMVVAGGLFLLWDRLAPVPAEDIVHSLERQQDELEHQD